MIDGITKEQKRTIVRLFKEATAAESVYILLVEPYKISQNRQQVQTKPPPFRILDLEPWSPAP